MLPVKKKFLSVFHVDKGTKQAILKLDLGSTGLPSTV